MCCVDILLSTMQRTFIYEHSKRIAEYTMTNKLHSDNSF